MCPGLGTAAVWASLRATKVKTLPCQREITSCRIGMIDAILEGSARTESPSVKLEVRSR